MDPLWAYYNNAPIFWQMKIMNIFLSLRTFQSFCETCQKDVVLNSSILVNFLTRFTLQKFELNYNSWPEFVSVIQTQPGKSKCPDCETPTCEPVLTSVAHSVTSLFLLNYLQS